jgi:methylmalonyl-CoA mutase cobalamin-binding subunit
MYLKNGGSSMFKTVKVEDAIGMAIAHDLTKIVPNEYKGPAFKKGHIISSDDVQKLKDMGKYHIYVLEIEEGVIHENEAADRIAACAVGNGLICSKPSEGKITIKSSIDGVLKINSEALFEVNSVDQVMFSTIHGNSVLEKDKKVAGTRVIPLVIDEKQIEKVQNICREKGPLIWARPFLNKKAGIVVTGSEVFDGRIKDKFGPVMEEKFRKLGIEVLATEYSRDDAEMTAGKIENLIKQGAEIIICAGGMSVDPDDLTPAAIKAVSDEVVTYGAPVLPGAMFMLAYKGDVAIMGVPACAMFHRATALELVLPRIITGERMSKGDIVRMGEGGFCLGCDVCTYPVCPFGK